jgi:hypothetical protein
VLGDFGGLLLGEDEGCWRRGFIGGGRWDAIGEGTIAADR